MKVYSGYTDRTDTMGPTLVTVQEDGSVGRRLKHEVRHSPTGFSWGYAGSGPADLARSILADYLGRVPHPMLYQQFKFDVVARLPQGQSWRLTGDQINAWLREQAEDCMTAIDCDGEAHYCHLSLGHDGDHDCIGPSHAE